MVIFFIAEVSVSLWIMVAMSVVDHESSVEHISITGHHDIDLCLPSGRVSSIQYRSLISAQRALADHG
ncbi:hypothetical protein SCLCIDRAFT_277108 [Scleroderma citrinum Foug A]|uniref:Uncharacterized protein n=1 Tax=Scleroderma citrinum Foug A TaxID=1036808 RepID=A0A0C2Z260_9AGAM|nr:hypothetical protein SCLCIDRAFT_277108 [Scleroderma citrinum Foug A]